MKFLLSIIFVICLVSKVRFNILTFSFGRNNWLFWFLCKIFAASDESTTTEPLLAETTITTSTTTKKSSNVEATAKTQLKASVRVPASQARDLYENVEIAVEGRPIPADFVALSPLDCS